MKSYRHLLCALLISSALLPPLSAYADLINGDFEDGTTGWTLVNEGNANPITLTSGTTVTSAGTTNASLTGDSYVYTSQTGEGRSILYQTFTVGSGTNKIFFDVSIKNNAAAFTTPNTLAYSGEGNNQQARFDILRTGSVITSMDPADIIVAAYRTDVGDSTNQNWTTVEVDLTAALAAYAGQDVILRYAQVDNQGYFNLALDNINVGLTQIAGSGYYFVPVSSGGTTVGAAGVLDNLIAGTSTPSTRLNNELTTLKNLPDAERADALQRIAPNTSVAMASVSNQIVQGGFSEVGGRIGAIRSFQTGGSVVTGISSGDDYEQSSLGNLLVPNSFWGKIYGFKGHQNIADGYAGYESLSKSMMLGYDIIPAENFIVGAVLGYANTNVDMDDYRNGDKTDIDSYQFSLYGSYAFEEDWALDLVASYARHEYEATRNTSSDVAISDFGANHYGLRADVSHSLNLPSGVTIIPKGGVEWMSLKQDSYQETNSVFAQDFDSTKTYRFNSNLSVEARKEYETQDGYTFVPHMQLGWKHQFRTDGASSTSRFVEGGEAFATQGQSSRRNGFNVKVGTEIYSKENVNLDIAFDGDFAEDYKGYGAQIQVKWKF